MDNSTKPDFDRATSNQKKTWASGDFNQISRQNWAVAEELCRQVNPRPGQRVLDVCCGSGTAALVAERRYCEVTGIDYVPSLIERAEERALANGQNVNFVVGDAQNLPFDDNSFDVLLSVYGIQFAPDQQKAASELLRVCRPGGVIALAGPVPSGWSGEFFSTHARYNPPPQDIPSPLFWGTEDGVQDLLGSGCSSIETAHRTTLQYYLNTKHAVDVFRTWFGPTIQACEQLNAERQDDLLRDLEAIFEHYNRSGDQTAIVENIYLETIAVVSE